MNKKDLIRELMLLLAHDEPMNKVMMMAQAVSFELYNKSFSDWVCKEQRGYLSAKDDDIPQYRNIPCILKVDIFFPFRGVLSNFTIPADIIKEQYIRKFVSSVKLPQSLSELEQIHNQNGGSEIKLGIPGSFFPYIDGILEKGNVQGAYRVIAATAPFSIINTVKAKMLDFFSHMSHNFNMDSDFNNDRIQEQLEIIFKQDIWNER